MYLSLRASQGDESTREKEFLSWLRARSLLSTWVRIGDLSRAFIPKICSGLILISRLSPRKLGYPWVMTPLGNVLG